MKKYFNTKYGTKVERRNYSKINYDLDLPNLIDIQTKSFDLFLHTEIKSSLENIFPVESYNGDLKLHFNDFCLEKPKFDVQESKKRGFTYGSELFLKVTLENILTKQTKTARILMTDLPLMTSSGTFVINGTERVVVSQIVRSAGAYFTSKFDNKANKHRFVAQIIPTRGAWIEFEQSNKELLYTKLDRSKKIPLTKFIHALGFNTQKEIEMVFGNNTLLNLSFHKDNDSNSSDAIVELYSKLHQGEKVPTNAAREFIRTRLFDREKYDLSFVGRYKLNKKLDVLNRVENTFLAQDLKNCVTGEILLSEGTFLTRNIIEQLKNKREHFRVELVNSEFHLENKTNDVLLTYKKSESDDNLYIKDHIFNLQTGEILVEADTVLNDDVIDFLNQNRSNIEDKIAKYFSNKKNAYKCTSDQKKVLNEFLEVYILDDKNNKKIVKIIGNNQEEKTKNIVLSDIIASISYYLNLHDNIGFIDDIDYLGNRRLRLIGELLKNQLRVGLNKTKKSIKDRMSISKFDSVTPGGLFNFSSLSMAIKTFFCSSRLSHFMDQINPLAIITQKRRISALGTGGIDRDRAGVELRDVNDSYYGRLCPIETPEGPSIGLICSLATYAQVDKYGFIKTPFFKIIHKNGITVVSNDYEYLTSIQEEEKIIASASTLLDENNVFQHKKVIARKNGEIGLYDACQVDYIDVSPKQIVSVATASIPFLEHNDASRALMGANMQRQALPLLVSESPIVATGIEHRIVKDSGCVIAANESGRVIYVDAIKIIIQENNGNEVTYKLTTFTKSNQDTLILQKPIVNQGEYVAKGDIIADGPSTDKGELALGKNVTVAFMTWDGYNYEDAVIISERLVQEDIYTSVHINKYEIQVRELKKGAGKEEITREIPNVSAESIKNLDSRGIIIPGSEVNEGDYLVGKIVIIPQGSVENTPYEKLIQTIIGEKARDYKDASLRMPFGESGIVQSVQYFSVQNGDVISTPGVNEIVKVYIVKKRKIKEGDKIAGRHGNKGVISCIAAKADMPYMSDGTPIDVILNPLGVPSRMNIGQILEMHLGIAAKKLGIKVTTPVLDGVNNEDLQDIMKEANLSPDGKVTLYDGKTGEPYDNPVSVGVLYMLKLSHMVEDKIHARNVGSYTLILQQPGSGRNFLGGQRMGEMEVWSLLSYGAANTLQEILTVKSDDIIGRNKTYNAIVNGLPLPKPSIPESFRVFTKELQALGLHVELIKSDTKENQVNRSLVNNNKEKNY
ncbi:DNA-directed RNA polymerase subunit beta [Candidatus Phytoplasma melaleucae]|uniref:DNA-directed RNA polymerase subunit beta n=1 Tax=Candidatus Phytoplasma melaleucae TaxID=2982630 RepID=A0ABT9DDT4_9MOLU|nr:DNA-directed RNA polymerase subunit beta ['Melaleuca sp.' phytoplasma]MDO8168179.1 DNA-directed RNA polymerase subunit beta ['Melaleuca sp.' phytoplasma]